MQPWTKASMEGRVVPVSLPHNLVTTQAADTTHTFLIPDELTLPTAGNISNWHETHSHILHSESSPFQMHFSYLSSDLFLFDMNSPKKDSTNNEADRFLVKNTKAGSSVFHLGHNFMENSVPLSVIYLSVIHLKISMVPWGYVLTYSVFFLFGCTMRFRFPYQVFPKIQWTQIFLCRFWSK